MLIDVVYDLCMTQAAQATEVACDKVALSQPALTWPLIGCT